MSILGNRVLRREDPKFLTSGGIYGEDLALDGAVWATFVRSTVAHARIAGIDADDARKAPGVVAVYTGADIDLPPVPAGVPGSPDIMGRPVLATGVVRFAGEAVAVVLTEERYQGEDAAETVFVEYDPLPAVVDAAGGATSETLLFPEHGSNVAMAFEQPLEEHFFDDCEVVVRQRIINQRLAPCPLEVRSGAATWSDDGRLTQWASNQAPHGAKADLAQSYGLDPGQIRVIAPDVGGGFGAKIGLYAEDLVLPWLARESGRTVRWTENRSESMLAMGHGRAQVQDMVIGGSRDGRVSHYRVEVLQDCGAYPSLGAFLPALTRMMASGTYDIANVEFSARSIVTNTTPTVAYRGAGRPEATACVERAMDLFAAEIGRDPAEVRRTNLIAKDAFPFTTPTETVYDCGDYEEALNLVLESAGYQHLRTEQARRREAGDAVQMGIGVSTYVEITNGAGPPGEFSAVEILRDGKAKVYTGTSPHGQGHHTAWSMLASEQLGIPMDDIEVVASDTDLVREGGGTMGSRSLQSGGLAVHEASITLVAQARKLAADMLEASPDDVVLDKAEGRFHVTGTPSVSRTWAEVAAASDATDGLRVEQSSSPSGPTFPFGAHVAVIEIDIETQQCASCAWSRSTTPVPSSTRSWPKANVTVAWPRAQPRPSSKRSATTPTATR